jgi:2-iminoacetate synthase
MSFVAPCAALHDGEAARAIEAADEAAVLRALAAPAPGSDDLAALLSPAAQPHLEALARRAHETTVRHCGRTIQLFTPLYLSNHCTNGCVYCGFNTANRIPRAQLTPEQALDEGRAIAATGLRQLLLLTGEAPARAGTEYIAACARLLRPLFPSLAVEVHALSEDDYRALTRAGVDGMTMFQETYDRELYATLHPRGPKRDFAWRLDAPERACRAGMRTVNLGALLGLAPWRLEVFATAMHARYLQRRYPGVDLAISLPRMRPHAGSWQPAHPLTDRALVQAMAALRLFLPQAGITISTRESPALRDNLVPLGVTRMSAGVSTAVGGHTGGAAGTGQFEISDPRGVQAMCAALRRRGYQPVFKDWEPLEHAGQPLAAGGAPRGAA